MQVALKVNKTAMKTFFTTFSHTLLLYLCSASQMALLGFYHNSPLFTSPVTSIHAGEHDNTHCERECMWRGIHEDRGTKNLW